MLQGVFAHNLFEYNGVSARFAEFRLLLDLDTVFEDIIHSAGQPSLVIGGEEKVIAFASGGGVTRFADRAPDPDIIVIIGIGMPQHKENIIPVAGILVCDGKIDRWLIVAFPLLTGERHIFFKNVRWESAAGPLEATGDQKYCYGLFQ